jgi:hypothetical protein
MATQITDAKLRSSETNELVILSTESLPDEVKNKYEEVSTIKFANNTNYKVNTVLTSINYSLAENIKNSTCTFTTAEDFGTCTFSVPATVKVNKAISFEGGKSYIIAVDNNILLWTEVQANSDLI